MKYKTDQFLNAVLLLAINLTSVSIFSASAIAQEIARLDSAEGKIEILRSGQADFKPAALGTLFHAHDVIHTKAGSKAGIAFVDGSLVRLAENSSLEFKPRDANAQVRPLAMTEGRAYFFNREPKLSPIVDTPSATTAVRGTEFTLEVTATETKVAVLDGAVDISNSFGVASLVSGEQASAKKGHAPVKEILLKPLDAVQWALYYPVVFSEEDLVSFFPALTQMQQNEFLTHARADSTFKFDTTNISSLAAESFRLYRTRDNSKARELLRAVHAKLPAGVQIFEASLALSDGDVAAADIILANLALNNQPDSLTKGAFLAQRAIISLTKNEPTTALEEAHAAAKIAPNLGASALALAYVMQGNLNFDGAKKQLTAFVAAHPHDTFALSHLAEIELGAGDYQLAKQLADRALQGDPNNWYALTVLGFSELISGNAETAKGYFARAIESDSSAALPRLGTGLTLINQGNLTAGREELAKAVYLAPNVAIYRSYLGKAFFEEKREKLAGHEFERAIALDDKDPTPYLYRAFNQLSQNKPVLALRDIEESIQLNNNRAVYRSSLLLDQDLGVRSAGLAEAFNAVGFPELARTEAIKSLNRDYGNYSAHLLLSEGYQSILLNDASLSERKVAELLAPISFNLFQRQAGDASLNEYSALFDRPESRTQLGFTGSSYADLVAPSAHFATKGERYGFGMGYDPIFTGGRTRGDYSQLHRGSLAFEYQPEPENRYTIKGTNLFQRFRSENGSPDTFSSEGYSVSLGYFHRFSAGSKLIADVSASNEINHFGFNGSSRDIDLDKIQNGESIIDTTPAIINELTRERVRSERAAMQHIFDSNYVSMVTGIQQYQGNARRNEESLVLSDENEIFDGLGYYLRSRQTNILNAHDVYNYSTFHVNHDLHLTLGGAWSYVQIEDREISPFVDNTHSYTRFNPKAGFLYTPLTGTTFRGGYFETLRKSSLENNLSIEPTLVGGINQRFTDLSGTRSRNLGLGIDQKLWSGTYLGAEALNRRLVDTLRGASSGVPINFDDSTIDAATVSAGDYLDNHRTQDVLRTYWYQVLSKTLVSSLEYEWTALQRTNPDLSQDITNQSARAALRYFDSSGFYPFIVTTWRGQDRRGGDFLADGTTSFALVDAGVGYRFPNRQGAATLQVSNLLNKDFTYDQSLGTEPFVNSRVGVGVSVTFNF